MKGKSLFVNNENLIHRFRRLLGLL